MEQAAAAPAGEEGEVARRDCVDLILRIWERRHHWPLSSPLKDVAAALEEITNPKPRYFTAGSDATSPMLALLDRLQKLHQHQVQLCLSGWIAGLDLTNEREYLRNHAEHLADEERLVAERLVEIQDGLFGPDASLAGEPCPDFAKLSENERVEWIRQRLQAITEDSRRCIVGEVADET